MLWGGVVGRRAAFAALTATGATLVALGALEFGVRCFVAPQWWAFRDATADWQVDARLGWVQRPHLDVTTRTEHGWVVRFRTNQDGLAPPWASPAREPGVPRILVFGDSTVVGRAVPQNKTLTAQLARLFEADGWPVEVFNAGVQGYSTDQVLIRMRSLVPLYRPDIVIYGLCENDFGGNVSGEAFGQAKPRFALDAAGRLQEQAPAPRSEITAVRAGLSSWAQHAALYRFVQPTLVVWRARFGGWAEQNLLGLPSPIFYDRSAAGEIDWRLFTALLEEMRDVARRNNAELFFYAHPGIEAVWDPYIERVRAQLGPHAGAYDRYALERVLQGVAHETAVEFVPMVEYFVDRQDRGPFHLLPRDRHASPSGYRHIAERLHAHLHGRIGETRAALARCPSHRAGERGALGCGADRTAHEN